MTPGPILILACPHCHASTSMMTWGSSNSFGATLWTDGKLDGAMVDDEVPITRCHRCANYFWKDSAEVTHRIGEDRSDEEQMSLNAAASPSDLTPRDLVTALRAQAQWTRPQECELRIRLWRNQNDLEREEQQPNDGLSPYMRQFLARAPEDRRPSPEATAKAIAERTQKMSEEYPAMVENTYAARRHKMASAARLGWKDEAKRLQIIDCPPKDGPEFSSNLDALVNLLDAQDPNGRIVLTEIARQIGDFSRALVLTDFDHPASLAAAARAIQECAVRNDRIVRPIVGLTHSRSDSSSDG